MASRLGQRLLRAKSKTENFGYFLFICSIFVSVAWLRDGKLFTLIKETVSLT